MINLDDILREELNSDNFSSKKKAFAKKLKSLIENSDAHEDIANNTEQRYKNLLKLLSPKKNDNDISENARKNIDNMLNENVSTKRETIIEIAYVLSDKNNGEVIANDLLQSIGYPKLHASSEIELLFIYAFRNSLSFESFKSLYNEYISPNRIKIEAEYNENIKEESSTYFYNQIQNISNRIGLFSFLDKNAHYFGKGSKKLSKLFNETFEKMRNKCETKISKQALKLDFYLYYASNLKRNEFLENYDKCWSNEAPRTGYDAYMDTQNDYDFLPIRTSDEYEMTRGIRFSTIFDGTSAILDEKATISREGLLLWLVFYYCNCNGEEQFYNVEDINEILSCRFRSLDEADYFDKFVITILNFSLDNNKVLYDGEEIETTKSDVISFQNIHELRHSIIRKIWECCYFDESFASKNFLNTNNSTSFKLFENKKYKKHS